MKSMEENHQRDLQELEVDKINLLFTDLILQQFGIYTDSQEQKLKHVWVVMVAFNLRIPH